MFYASRVIAIMVLKFANFRYQGNRGRSKQSLTDTVKLSDPENLCGHKFLGYTSYASWVMGDFVLKISNFRYHGNRGRSEQIVTDTFKLSDPENLWGHKFLGYISYASWVMGNFVLKFSNFRYHGNKGRSERSFADTMKSVDPQNPVLGASTWAISLTPPEL